MQMANRPVRNFGVHALDGEWTNSSSVVSGNGTAGGDFEFRLNVQPADVDNSGSVTLFDHTTMLTKLGLSTADSGYSMKYDIDGNGMVDAGDLLVAVDRVFQASRLGHQLA